MHDLLNHINIRPAIYPAASFSANTPVVTQAANLQGYDSVVLALMTGAAGTAGATYTVSLTEGNLANLSDQAAVTAYEVINGVTVFSQPPPNAESITPGLTLASFTGALVNGCAKLGYIGNKQYIVATITPAGNSAAAFVSAMWIFGHPSVFPTPNPPV